MRTVRVAKYRRYSTGEGGSSLGDQDARIDAYVKSQNTADETWVVVADYPDEVSGARTENRDGYRRLMAEIDSWDVLAAAAIDRVHRDTLNFLLMMEELKSKGKHFVSLQEKIDTSGPFGEVLLKLFAVLAEFERAKIRERAIRGHAASRRRGFASLRRMPNGFEIVETRADGSRVVAPMASPRLVGDQQRRRFKRLMERWSATKPWVIPPPNHR